MYCTPPNKRPDKHSTSQSRMRGLESQPTAPDSHAREELCPNRIVFFAARNIASAGTIASAGVAGGAIAFAPASRIGHASVDLFSDLVVDGLRGRNHITEDIINRHCIHMALASTARSNTIAFARRRRIKVAIKRQIIRCSRNNHFLFHGG